VGTVADVTREDEQDISFPTSDPDEKELLLQWLGYVRNAVLRDVEGLSDAQARWRPDGRLISLLGIVNHLTRVEWRWIDGGFLGADVHRSEEEFAPGADLTVEAAVDAYRNRAVETDRAVRSMPLTQVSDPQSWAEGKDLRWVLLHLINETARHAGHADATREMLDGTTGE
jgi:uncharacterized damage-inducible protein DinB